MAYKHYQLLSLLKKNYKIANQFALRRIINKNYEIWKKNNSNKVYYEFLRDKFR